MALQEYGKVAKANKVGVLPGYRVSAPGNQALAYPTSQFKLRNTSKAYQVLKPLSGDCRGPKGNRTTRKGYVTLFHLQDKSSAANQYVVANVHLTPREACAKRRVSEAKAVVARIGSYMKNRKSAALVVLGDFNTGGKPGDAKDARGVATFKSIKVAGAGTRKMKDILPDARTANWGWDEKPENDTKTIDRIYVNTAKVNPTSAKLDTGATITYSDCSTPFMTASDHHLLRTNLWWPTPQ